MGAQLRAQLSMLEGVDCEQLNPFCSEERSTDPWLVLEKLEDRLPRLRPVRRRKRRPVEPRGESSTTEDLSMLSRLSDARRDPTPTPKYDYPLKCVIIPAHVKLREIFSNVTSP